MYLILSDCIENFIREVKIKNLHRWLSTIGQSKLRFAILFFWRENYAANYLALVEHKILPLPEDISTINLADVLLLKRHSLGELIIRLRKANKSLYESIVIKIFLQMTYSKDRRIYELADFWEMITRHIYTKQGKRANNYVGLASVRSFNLRL